MTNIAREILFESSLEINDALTLLSQYHRHLMELFARYNSTLEVTEKCRLSKEIQHEIQTNIQIEEEIFYPALKRVLQEHRLRPLIAMHHSRFRYLLAELQTIEPHTAIYDIKLRVIGEHVNNFHREKQAKLFAKVSAARDIDLWWLGAQLAQRKADLQL